MRAVPRPWPRDGRHSDISLAMLARTAGIRWCHIEDMIGPHDSFNTGNLKGAVSVHVKDRASFSQLYAPLTEGQ
jgi:hypothetical protein